MNSYQDTIKSLPVDNEPIDNVYIADSLFGGGEEEKKRIVGTLADEFKDSVLIVVLFMVFSSDQVSNIIKKYIPMTNNSEFALMGAKCVLILFLYYVVRNFQLIRK